MERWYGQPPTLKQKAKKVKTEGWEMLSYVMFKKEVQFNSTYSLFLFFKSNEIESEGFSFSNFALQQLFIHET